MTLHAHTTARDQSPVMLDNTEHGVLYVISRNQPATLNTLCGLCHGVTRRPLKRILHHLHTSGVITRAGWADDDAITITELGHGALRADG